ncbi:MAG: hypothetical protein AB1453_03440 [Chloroflexota bacterium]
METKTYQCETMFEALQKIQQELGADAIVLSAREIPMGPVWNVWGKKGIEVVASPPPNVASGSQAESRKPKLVRRSADGSRVEFTEESQKIEWVGGQPAFPPGAKTAAGKPQRWQPQHISRAEIESVRKSVPEQVVVTDPPPAGVEKPADAPLPESLRAIEQRLLGQGVESAFLERILCRLNRTIGAVLLKDVSLTRQYVQEVLAAELHMPAAGALRIPSRWVCLVGASGSGKTSVTAKLALLYSQHLGKRVAWICADTVRTGAIAEARSYTDALGIPLRLIYNPPDARIIADEMTETDVFLVDTAGFNPCREDQLVELGGLLSEIPQRTTLLAASALTRESDLNQISAALGVFHLNGVVFTRMDETTTFGSVYNFGRRSVQPIRYFCYGKETAGRLQAASASRLAAALFGKGWDKE